MKSLFAGSVDSRFVRHLFLTGVVVLAAGVWGRPASGAVVVNDTFDVGAAPTRGDDLDDPADAAWFRRWSTQPDISIVADSGTPGIGSGNALRVSANSAQRAVIGTFAPTTLGVNVGDKIQLSLNVRMAGGSPNSGELFSVGLYNSNNTKVTADNQTASANDSGYFAGMRRTSGAATIRQESGMNLEIGSGTDITTLGDGITAFALANGDPHVVIFTLTRTATGIDLGLVVDGNTLVTTSTSTNLITTFDEITFLNGATATDYLVDNVRLENIAVPEAASAGLVGAGLAGLMLRRGQK